MVCTSSVDAMLVGDDFPELLAEREKRGEKTFFSLIE
jgi:hypothetical protein